MNIPPLKSILLGLLLIPALVGAMEEHPSAAGAAETAELPSSETDQTPGRIYWLWGRPAYDPNNDTFVREALVLEDYFPRLNGSRVAQLTCSHLLVNIALLLGAWKLLATMARTS